MEKIILKTFLGLGLAGMVFTLRKRPRRKWVSLFVGMGLLSSTVDRILVQKGYLYYPRKLFPNKLHTSILFDFIICPVTAVLYNQVTQYDKFGKSVMKLLPFSFVHLALELYFVRYTKLIQWRQGWSWYHSLLSMSTKYLLTRAWLSSFMDNTEEERLQIATEIGE